jgi:hypothetical protein
MSPADPGPGLEIVAREDFSDATYLPQVRHPVIPRAAQRSRDLRRQIVLES